MPSAQALPPALMALGREAVETVASTGDITSFRGAALLDPARDCIFQPLPSYEAAKDAIYMVPLVADRYGTKNEAGDRLTLQFVYQLFPRIRDTGIGEDVRRLWRGFLAELKVPDWEYRAVANLRNFTLENSATNLLRLAEGVTIRGRVFDKLRGMGFNDFALDGLAEDWREGRGSSPYVICAEYRQSKSPDNLIRTDAATGFFVVQRAITSLRLAGAGDVIMGPMWFARPTRFSFGIGSGTLRGGWTLPSIGGSKYLLTRTIARETRSLQADVRYLEANGYGKGPGNLDVALQSFRSTYERVTSGPDFQLMDTITAVEALLSEGANTFKLAFRVAGMLGRTDAERVHVFEDMMRFYKIRNSIVHGDRLTEARVRTLARVDDIRGYIRRLLVAFVRLAASSSQTRYTKQFFRENLDTELQEQQARRRMLRDLGLIPRLVPKVQESELGSSSGDGPLSVRARSSSLRRDCNRRTTNTGKSGRWMYTRSHA